MKYSLLFLFVVSLLKPNYREKKNSNYSLFSQTLSLCQLQIIFWLGKSVCLYAYVHTTLSLLGGKGGRLFILICSARSTQSQTSLLIQKCNYVPQYPVTFIFCFSNFFQSDIDRFSVLYFHLLYSTYFSLCQTFFAPDKSIFITG